MSSIRRAGFAVLLSLPLIALPTPGHAADKVPLIFDTDIESDVDDVGTVAVLHALADAGEVDVLAMGVSAKHKWCVPCLDALNTYFGRPDIPIGVLKGKGAQARDSKYCRKIAEEFSHDLKSAADVPDAALLYRKILAAQPDNSVVMVTVGFLTNFANLLKTKADKHSPLSGIELVKKKVKTWVCMGGTFPKGKEWNVWQDATASQHALDNWPTPIVFSGYEIGKEVNTGAGLSKAPKTSPVRRSYELYNGLKDRHSWDQTAVLYAVRGLDGGLANLWDLHPRGAIQVAPDGSNTWQNAPDGNHTYLVEKAPPKKVAAIIEELMLRSPKSPSK